MPAFALRRSVITGGVALVAIAGALFVGLSYSTRPTSTPSLDTAAFTIQAVPAHIQELKAADPAVRQQAALALWQIGAEGREATPALREAVRDPEPEVRAAAAKALGHTGQESIDAVPALVEALKDKATSVRLEAAVSLAQIFLSEQNASAATRLRGRREREAGERLAEGRNRGRAQAQPDKEEREEREEHEDRDAFEEHDMLTRLKPEAEAVARSAIPVLTGLLKDDTAGVRAAAASALAEAGPLTRPAVPDLILILQEDPDPDARLQATLAMGNVGPAASSAVPVLAKKLHDDDYGIRANCAQALGRIHSNPEVAVPALVEAYLKDKADVHVGAAMALDRYGIAAARIALPLVQQAIKEPANRQNEELQKRAARVLEICERKLKEAGAAPPAKPSSRQ